MFDELLQLKNQLVTLAVAKNHNIDRLSGFFTFDPTLKTSRCGNSVSVKLHDDVSLANPRVLSR